MTFRDPDINKIELLQILKSSLDALDRLYRPDRGEFLGTVSNNESNRY